MPQESYADYSIIHKYLEQQKLHDEEIQRYKDSEHDMSESLSAAQAELEEMQKRQEDLESENEALRQQTTDRENEITRLNNTISNLNQKIAALTKGSRR